jgi:hypothetical protein
MGITSMVKKVSSDSAFTSRLSKVYEFLTKNKNRWAGMLESQMVAFFGNSKIKLGGGSYYVMRADMIPNDYDPYRAL